MSESISCRLCLYNCTVYDDIYSEKMQNSEMAQKIAKYLYIEIKEDDEYTKNICNKCIERIDSFHLFSLQVIANQEALHYTLGTVPVPVEPNTVNQIEKQNACNVNDYENLIDHTINKNPLKTIEPKRAVPRKKATTIISEVEKVGMKKGIIKKPTITNACKKSVAQNSEQTLITEMEIKKEIKTEQYLEEFSKNVENSSTTEMLNDDCDADDDGECYDSDTSADLFGTNLTNDDDCSDSDCIDEWPSHDNEHFPGFPKVILKDCKLIIRGKQLANLMSRFFRLECDLCNDDGVHKNKQTFKRFANLCSHYKEIHSVSGYVICCGIKLYKARTMVPHMCRHLQPEAFTCKKCGKIMTSPQLLESHLQNHLPEHERPLACPNCPRRFIFSSLLKEHLISHQPEHERAAHSCDECGKSFFSQRRLSAHIRLKQARKYICHICAKQFGSQSNITSHLATHQPRLLSQVQCSVKECRKWLKNKACLGKHMTMKHSTVRHNCTICEYSSLNKQYLKNHMQVQHSDVKPYSCEICGKTFKLRGLLKNHIGKHTGAERDCEFCPRTFASLANYYKHRKRMHSQELAAIIEKREEEERVQRNVMLAEKVKEKK